MLHSSVHMAFILNNNNNPTGISGKEKLFTSTHRNSAGEVWVKLVESVFVINRLTVTFLGT